MVGEVISGLFTIGAAAWAWWKNNSFTKAAIAGDEVMNQIKAEENDTDYQPRH